MQMVKFGRFFLFGVAFVLAGIGVWNLLNPQLLVEWSTASEVDTLGFNIYRSEDENGPFDKKINSEVIPSQGETIVGSEYQLKDGEVIAGKTYYYMLEEVQMGGGSEQFGPIEIKVKAFAWLELGAGLIMLVVSIVSIRSLPRNEMRKITK